ncbi:MAG TPA: Uma2 family endonuclease [Chloroflexota bacterium]|nr:Uma2 family endonuclease [Chloroflexota bacterium]HUM68504.1 Uma2 family endonuclease [Chloroflexota bacterium]
MSQFIEVLERYEIPDLPPTDLPEEDGEPLESNWHRDQINLLIDVVRHRWADRSDFFAGGNMFIYYSLQQVRNRDYKGPDFFVVKDIYGSYSRQKWVVWEENGRYPNSIIELMSPTTKETDLGLKKDLYRQTFRTADYFCFDPDENQLQGWRLVGEEYVPIEPDDNGRLWSSQLEAWLGTWEGVYQKETAVWLRLYDETGQPIPTATEAERQRAEAAEAEVAELRRKLAQYEDS